MKMLVINDEEGELPMPATRLPFLYRYMPDFCGTEYAKENFRRLLLSLEIRASNAAGVNDPLDCNPAYVSDLNIGAFRNAVKYWRDTAPENTAQLEFKGSLLEQFPNDTSLRKIRRVPNKWSNSFQRTIMRAFNSFGFVCYSEKKDDPLMWAHYATSHRGLCVEFPTQPSFETNLLSDVPLCAFAVPIEYVDDRPKIVASKNIPIADPNALQAAISKKSRHWEYEKEWRVFGKQKINSLLAPSTWERIGVGQPISSIIFGLKSSCSFKKEVFDIVEESGLRINFKECYLSDRDFNIRIRTLKNTVA